VLSGDGEGPKGRADTIELYHDRLYYGEILALRAAQPLRAPGVRRDASEWLPHTHGYARILSDGAESAREHAAWAWARRGPERPAYNGRLMADITLHPIGVVRNGEEDLGRLDWSRVESRIDLSESLGEALLGLRDYSHVIVLGWLDRYPPEYLARRTAYPSGDERLPLQGALALRGVRPNPVSVTVCELRGVEGDSLTVRGLDLVDGTPVIDVKPYIAFYDSVPKAKIPKWAGG